MKRVRVWKGVGCIAILVRVEFEFEFEFELSCISCGVVFVPLVSCSFLRAKAVPFDVDRTFLFLLCYVMHSLALFLPNISILLSLMCTCPHTRAVLCTPLETLLFASLPTRP